MKKNNKRKKEFDAVKMMREIREKISLEIKDMSFEELRAYIDLKLSKKNRLIGKH
jgi:protein subunit release factor B